MSKSIATVNAERRAKYNTVNNKFSDFPIGSRVQVICVCQDFTFFNGTETGTVVKNSGDYIGIIVQFDEEYNMLDFNFAPDDLLLLEKPALTKEHALNLIKQARDKSAPLAFLEEEFKKL